jgi:tripartite ATP-independent transporter DctM subunit
MIPGFILATLLMLTVVIQVKLNPNLAPKPPKYTWRERLTAVKEIAPFIAIIFVVLGAIFGGIMTPTEAASLGAFLSIVSSLAYRRLTFSAFKQSMWTAVRVMSMVAFISITARVLSIVFQYIGITQSFGDFMLDLPFGKYGIWAIVCVMYLVLGMFFDAFAMLFLTLPFVTPLIASLGFDPIWFGVVYVVLVEIGLVTPPFGLNLFTLHSVVPHHDIITIALGALPYLIPALLTIALLTIFPELVLWLPSVLY